MKQIFCTFLYLLVGLMLGIVISEQIISTDQLFKEMLRDKLIGHFQHMYGCRASARVQSINLVQGTFILTDVHVYPHHAADDWCWRSNQCTIQISPFAWLFTHNIPVQLDFDFFTIDTCYKNKICTIIPHFQQLFKVPEHPTPFFIHQLSLNKVHGHIYNEQHNSLAHFDATFEMLWQNNLIDNRIIITDATITIANLIPFKLHGPLQLSIFNPLGNNNISLFFDQKLSCVYNNQSYQACIKGNWDNNAGLICLEMDGIEYARIQAQSDGSFTIQSTPQVAHLKALPTTFNITALLHGNIYNPLQNNAYNNLITTNPDTKTVGTWRLSYPFVYGKTITHYRDTTIRALICCNVAEQQAFIYLYNATDLTVGTHIYPAHHLQLLACINRSTYTVHGSFNDYLFHLHGFMDPLTYLPHGWLKQNNQQLLTIWPDHQQHIVHGSLDCNYLTHPQLQTSGFFNFDVHYHFPHITINGRCAHPWFIPALGNTITNITTQIMIDPLQQIIDIPKLQIVLHKGRITIAQGSISNHALHIPITIEHCFVRPDPDLYALISANLLLKKDTAELLTGDITLEQCHYAKNILAAELTQQMATTALNIPAILNAPTLNINVESAQPINVKTAFLTGTVHSHLKLTNTITNPIVEGVLDIAQATLHFPYKPLHITQGSLMLLPYQPGDPVINVTAKNRIKKYQITLRAHGTISNPIIHLESSPTLSNEQIIALLLTGSEERSLAITVPTLLMQQIQQLMFGPALANSSLAHYFKKFTRPFKNVRFIPHLTDQSARGGIRAGLEINYDDNLRAYIQKNLTLTEDTFFEVEYQCTDHVSVRGIKDEHGDLGAEVEMRWKF